MNSWDISFLRKLLGDDRVHVNEPMNKHTSFRIGGPADVMIEPRADELPEVMSFCDKNSIPVTIVGNGTNILVGDFGIRGVVIDVSKSITGITIEGEKMIVGAGEILSRVANIAAENGLTGMEFASGIPGSVGGAVMMNAGAYGGEMKDILAEASCVGKDLKLHRISVDAMNLSYRYSRFMEEKVVITEVVFNLKQGQKDAIFAKMGELSAMRIQKQPLEYPSAGSTFKRPEGNFAGKLIMEAGLADMRVGGAVVSKKHCGFVVNDNEATAADVKELIEEVTKRVKDNSGITLEPEVMFVGDFEKND